MNRRMPPYGKECAAHVKPNRLIWVFAGPGAWDAAKQRIRARGPGGLNLVAPPNEDPDTFDWRVARGCFVVLLEDGLTQAQLMRLVRALLRAGVKSISHGPGRNTFVMKDARYE